MSAGKIVELVDDGAIAQLDTLFKKLGIARAEMVEGIATARQYNEAIGNTKTISDFNAANQQAVNSLQNVATAQHTVTQLNQQAVAATNVLVEQTKAKALADADAAKVLQAVGGSLEQNIKLLVQQKLELAEVTARIKDHSKSMGDSTSSQVKNIETTAALTKAQIELKTAIAGNSLVIKQQVKESQAAVSSQDQMLAQVNLLSKAFDSLTVSERENAEIGGVLLAEQNRLKASIVELNEAQLKFTDNVGNYPGKANAAAESTEKVGKSMDITGRLAGVLTSRIFRMAASFILITVALGAVTWLAKWISGLDYFTGRLDQAVQNLKALNEVQKDADQQAAKSIVTSKILYNAATDVNNSMKDRLAAAKELKKEYPDALKNASDMAIANGLEKKSFDELTNSLIDNAKSMAVVKKLEENAAKEADINFEKAKIASTRMHQLSNLKGGGKMSPENAAALSTIMGGEANNISYEDAVKERVKDINRIADEAQNKQDKSLGVLQNTDKWLNTYAGGDDKIAKAIEAHDHKNAPKDKTINDDISNDKAHLELAKAYAKQTLDDEKSSYEARLSALKTFTEISNAIINLELKDKNSKKGITAKERDTNSTEAAIQRLGVKAFDQSEILRIQKEAAAEFKALVTELQTEVLDNLQDSLDKQLIDIKTIESRKAAALLESFQKRKIDEAEYNRDLKLLRDQANEDRIAAEVKTDEAILGVQEALLGASQLSGFNLGVTGKTVQKSANKLAKDQSSLIDAHTQTQGDRGKNDKKDEKDRLKDVQEGVKDFQELQQDAEQVMNGIYESQVAALEHKKTLIEEAATAEITGINNSILSSKEKAREENIVRDQSASQQKAIDQEIRKTKERQAKFDKAINIASIIENTAVAAMKTYAEAGFFGGTVGAVIVAALGAAQLAAVLATPIPQFEKGGTMSKSGLMITGEKGTELRIDPSGATSLTPGYANLSYAKAGTKIISNDELVRMMSKPEPINYAGGQAIDLRRLEKLTEENNELQKKKKHTIIHVHGDRWGTYSQQRNY